MYNNGKFYGSSREYHRLPHTKKKRVRHKELKQEQEDFTPVVNFCMSCTLLILTLILIFS